MVHVVVLVGQQGKGLRLLQPLLASLSATSPSMGTGLLIQNPWPVRLASTWGTKVCSFWSVITVIISCTMQRSQVLGIRPESKSPRCSSSAGDFFTRLIFGLKCCFLLLFLLLRLKSSERAQAPMSGLAPRDPLGQVPRSIPSHHLLVFPSTLWILLSFTVLFLSQ